MREFPYFVNTWVDHKKLSSQRITDPFIHTTVVIGLRDIVKAVFRRKIVVEVSVHGDYDTWKPICDIRESLPEKMRPPVKMENAQESMSEDAEEDQLTN